MTEPDHDRAAEIFADALDKPSSERLEFVRQACARDDVLHAEVCTLLSALPKGDIAFEATILQAEIRHAAASVVNSAISDRSGESISHYKLDRLLGRGGMGEVYHAWDSALGRPVAIKILQSGFDVQIRARLLREAQTNIRLEHPAIAAFYESGSADGTDFMAMEFVEGETLRSRLKSGPLTPPITFNVALSLLEALSHAHAHQIVHRDIKPENIMITPDGAIKLLDFGVAKKLNLVEDFDQAARTKTLMTEFTGLGRIVGTLGYMSPEQIQAGPITDRTDLFAVGIVLFEALSGEKMFPGSTPAQRMAATLTREVPLLNVEGVPHDVNAILARAMARDPAGRYPNAAAFMADLRGIFTGDVLASLPNTLAIVDPINLAQNAEDDWIGNGFGESLVVDLAKVDGLDLVQRSRVQRVCAGMAKRGENLDPVDIGISLGCRWVLIGSFQRIGSQLRLTMKLTEVAAGKELWSEKIDGMLDDLFKMQDRLATLTAESLQLIMPKSEGNSPPRLDAYEYHARGQRHLLGWGESSFAQARVCFEKAIELDPEHAPSLAGLAHYHAPGVWHQNSDPAELEAAKEYSRRAIAADPENVEGHLWHGYALWRLGRTDEALRSFHDAHHINPGYYYPSYFLSCVSSQLNRFDEAIAFGQKAARIEDRVPYVYHLLGTNHLLKLDFEPALWALQRGLEFEKDENGHGWGGIGIILAECLRLMGRPDDARRACLENLEFIQQKDYVSRSMVRSHALVILGRSAFDQGDLSAATASFQQSIALIEGQVEGNARGQVLVQALAGLARCSGDESILEKGIRIFDERGPYSFDWAGIAWDHMTLFDLACAALQLGRDHEARSLYGRAQEAGCRFDLH